MYLIVNIVLMSFIALLCTYQIIAFQQSDKPASFAFCYGETGMDFLIHCCILFSCKKE